VPGVIFIAALGLIAGSLMAAFSVYQIQRREETVTSDEISTHSSPNNSRCEQVSGPQNIKRTRLIFAV